MWSQKLKTSSKLSAFVLMWPALGLWATVRSEQVLGGFIVYTRVADSAIASVAHSGVYTLLTDM